MDAPSELSRAVSLATVSSSVSRIYDVERLGLSSYFLALLFLLMLAYALRQLWRIHGVLGTAFEPQKLFHMFVVTHCALRFLSFGVLSLFSLTKTEVYYPGLVMLFTLPEYFILSTYVLLYCLWLEVYVFAHDQFVVESRRAFRRQWVRWFFVLTTALYVVLCTLYVLLVLRPEKMEDAVVETILYSTAVGCFVLPVLMVATAAYFGLLLLSGFTFSSDSARARVSKMNEILGIWTFGRVLRGVLLFVSTLYHWQQNLNSTYLGMAVVSVLLVTEVLPLLAVLDWGAITIMLFGEASEQDLLYSAIGTDGRPAVESPPGNETPGADEESGGPRLSPLSAAAAKFVSHTPGASLGAPGRTTSGDDRAASASQPLLLSTGTPNSDGVVAAGAGSMQSPAALLHAYLLDAREVRILPGSDAQFVDPSAVAAAAAAAGLDSYQQGGSLSPSLSAPLLASSSGVPPFSSVGLAQFRGRSVFVKSYRLPVDDAVLREEQQALMSELAQDLVEQCALQHPNIVPFVGVALGQGDQCTVHVLSEYIAGGSLRQLLRSKSARPLEPATVLRLALHIAQGMEALHARHQVHGHLTSAHVMLDGPLHASVALSGGGSVSAAVVDVDAAVARVSDVGARRLKSYAEVLLVSSGARADPAYAAPELLREGGSQSAGQPADVFAFAVCLWELASQQVPWEGRDAASIYSSVVTGVRLRLPDSNLPPAYGKLVAACWVASPQMRPAFAQITQQLRRILAQMRQ